MFRYSHWLIAAGLLLTVSAAAQTSAAAAALTPEQTALFDKARADFGAANYKDALPEFQALHTQVPANTIFPKFAAEAAINLRDFATAKSLLNPILASSPDDFQALAMLAHDYAQERDDTQRDATLAHLQKLHDTGAAHLQSLVLESDPIVNGGFVRFFYYLEPYSMYKISVMARVFDANGKQLQRITLESGDFDQPAFAKEHPDKAAAGQRRYSMDGYVDVPAANGQPASQTHSTYGFFDGGLPFDAFRDRVLAIAAGKGGPISTTTGIHVQPAKQ